MQLELAYGKTGLTVELPDNGRVTVLRPAHVEGLADPMAALQAALRQPIGTPPLADMVRATDVVGIVFSDITRPAPSHLLIPAIRAALSHVPDERIVLFNATGTHRSNTDAELRGMLGDEIVERYRIVQHDAEDAAAHRHVGVTRGGNAVAFQREFLDCDARILTGFIEPHFFAGFSGGGKALMPGLAALASIRHNHRAQHMDHPQVRWGVTEGNPLWEDVMEAAEMARPTFLLNVTLNRHKQITGIFAGDLRQAHAAGCACVQESAMQPVPAPFDIVISTNSGYPLDLNMYQAVKGMSAAAQVVKEGGDIIVAADCWDGIPDHGGYGQLLREAADLDELLALVRTPGCRRQDLWSVHVHALICRKARVHFYSDNLRDEQIHAAKLIPCRSIEATVATLLERHGPDATICVIPEGPQTVPYVQEAVSAAGLPAGG